MRHYIGLRLMLGWLATNSCLLAADDFERAPIQYSATKPTDAIAQLQARLTQGTTQLDYKSPFGYLPALLRELKVPVSSQTLVFSKTSLQRNRISPTAPRSLYFNDEMYIGYCQSGDVLEISAVDPQLGAVFYTLEQKKSAKPVFQRQTDSCLICHGSSQTAGVPGHLIRSVFPDDDGQPLLSMGTYRIDQSSPIDRRWGGWYVTGTHGELKHLGNLTFRSRPDNPNRITSTAGLNRTSLDKRVCVDDLLSPHSDIVALMVLEHQTEAHNLLTRANFETQQALYQESALNREMKLPATHRWESTNSRIKSVCEPLLRYFLFSEEAELASKVKGTSTFAQEFAKLGPRDKQGRSLRELDLQDRLFKYPCSYLIYSRAFDMLHTEAKAYFTRRLAEVVTGGDTSKAFGHLSAGDRRALREIIAETKPDLAQGWLSPVK